jgi:hypothetical protein
MLLMKVLVGVPEEVPQLLSGKLALKYSSPEVRFSFTLSSLFHSFCLSLTVRLICVRVFV